MLDQESNTEQNCVYATTQLVSIHRFISTRGLIRFVATLASLQQSKS
jgi:hypothetical protein